MFNTNNEQRTTNNLLSFRADFPILSREVYGRPLVYFDNGATTQKPLCVLQTIERFYREINANIHRGVHKLSEESTREYENAREVVRKFLNARKTSEIIFTSGTTASINLVAYSFGEVFVRQGDEVLVTEMEHHSNIVPWQLLCERKGATLKVLPFDSNGELMLNKLPELLTPKTRIVAVTQVSNTLGTVNPIAEIVRIAHSQNIPVLVDGAQGVKHGKIDVQQLDADFYAFSGHKIYGPTGIGVLYGKEEWLERMVPWQGGGDMIATVSFAKTTFNELPFKFEAGTANYIGAAGLATALNYYSSIGPDIATAYEDELLKYATTKLKEIDGLTIYGNAPEKAAIISFLLNGIHPYDTGMILDKMGIAVRTGNHCTQPVIDHFGIDGTVRASLAFYNTFEEVDRLVEALHKVKEMFG
ncbi:MAG: cysteine desulfurase [Tenuifilum sp.]|uniref:aminotransferase class V-fold PLP-dependent enzyme n=1 Tax=Tenuifilum sp. TaxID=2760880 RepID=UPI001B60F0BC|nr:cysteine desulfurase [Bacteroidales bacterium]HOK60411.1 cysteine desulfurase [Tenuifilum sp.]MBP9030433.1 cysteine desulfurase [Bacteroidales bacterium]HOK85741.1 cysteine desulfurase [Tenuifilum sp.]HON70596.1 cysteine desulfurase [Tenuifilum sp.]